MKLFLVLFFAGCASALTHDVLKKASDDAVDGFVIGMSSAPALHEALGIPDTDEVRSLESTIKEELEKFLREAFDEALRKIEDAMKKGKEVHKEAWDKLQELKEKMKDLNIEESEFEEGMIEMIKQSIKDRLKELLEKLGVLEEGKRSVDFDEMMGAEEDIFGDLSFRNFVLKLKEMILEKMNVDTLRKGIAKAVGQGAKALCDWLTAKGKDKVLNFFDRLMETDEDRKRRSVSDLYEHIKEYFDELDLDFKEKFAKFGEWVKDVLEKGLDRSKNKIQNVRLIVKQLLEKSKAISKDVAKQALEYLKDYKQELGELYEKVHDRLMEKITEYTD